jgi:hypothetical protein
LVVSIDCEELVPPLALGWLDELVLGDVAALPLAGVPPLAEVLPLEDGELLLLVDGEVPPEALLLVDGCDELVLPLADGWLGDCEDEVEPVALPEPDDWLVCAPCVVVEDGLVLVAFWLAEAEPVDTP